MGRIGSALRCVALMACSPGGPAASSESASAIPNVGASGAPAAASGAPADEPTVVPGIGSAFCDGSDAIRLGMWTGAASLGGFMRPFGLEFAFVDGHCAYVASTSAADGIATGVLDATRVAELARDVGYARIAEFSAHTPEPCFEAQPAVVSDGRASFACGCGCDADSPPDLVAAEAASHRWIQRLVADAPRRVAAVRAAALIDEDGPYADSPAWPLSQPITDVLETVLTRSWNDAGKVFEDASDVAALRALRVRAASRGTAIFVVVGQQQYSLEVRDELPVATDAAVRAFLAAFGL
jgi:hypothetical protein